MFSMTICGITTVGADDAPVRREYPDGQIVAVLHKGAKVIVKRLVGDGRGSWIEINQPFEGKTIQGFLDLGFTTFGPDMAAGNLKQPPARDGMIVCPE